MRPIYVDMKAFGSYVDERIEFDKVKNGLFLITGQTGAGKTTVFDAITYALYGKTSGSMRSEKMIHSNYASSRAIPRVEYKFTYGEEVYTIIREAGGDDYTYVKKTDMWKKKAQPRSEKVQLFLPDGSEFVGKTKEINDKIKSIVKLDVDQFQQVVMLAQGEFTKLIKASSDQRQEILTQIFDSTVYDSIERNIDTRFKTSYGKITQNRDDIEKALNKVKLMDNSQYVEDWNAYTIKFSESNQEALLTLVKSIVDELKDKEEVILKENEILKKDIQQKDQKRVDALTLNKKFDDLELKQKQLKKHSQNEENIHEMILKNERANKAKEVDPSYQAVQSNVNLKEQKEKEVISSSKKIASYKEQLIDLEKKKNDASTSFEQNGQSLLVSIQNIENSYTKYDEFNRLKKSQDQLMSELKKTEATKTNVEKQVNDLKENNNKLKKNQEELLMNRKDPSLYDDNVKTLKNQKTGLENLKKDITQYQDDLHKLSALNTSIKNHEIKVEEAKMKYEDYYDSFIHNQALLIRSSLKDGDICPVCGNVHHTIETIDSQDESLNASTLQALKQDYENKKEQLTTLEKDKTGKESSLKEKRVNLDRNSELYMGNLIDVENNEIVLQVQSKISSIQQDIQTNQQLKKKAQEDNASIEKNKVTLKKQEDTIQLLTSQMDQLMNNINDLKQKELTNHVLIETLKNELLFDTQEAAKSKVVSLQSQYDCLKQVKEKAQKAFDDTQKLLQTEEGKIEALQKDVAKLEKDIVSLNEVFLSKLVEFEFKDEQDYLSSKMDLHSISVNQRKIEDYNKTKNELSTQIDMLKVDTKDKQRIDVSIIQNELKELHEKEDFNNKEYRQIVSLYSLDETSYKEAKDLYDKRAELIEEHTLIKDIYEVICGKVSKKHLTFKTFILRKYFKQMLRKANERLVVLSNNQFVLQCRDIDDLASSGKTGLDIDVYNMVTNKVSDAKALSGGESFITALSMALGMADLIQMNNGSVRIDTMFIDEGFGSLSDEVRNQAVSILQSMTDQNRLIGIISHVTELKNQVDTQLVVTKDEKGSHHEWKY